MTLFTESDALSDPLVFEDNVVRGYIDEGNVSIATSDQLNALLDMTSSGNVFGPCPQ